MIISEQDMKKKADQGYDDPMEAVARERLVRLLERTGGTAEIIGVSRSDPMGRDTEFVYDVRITLNVRVAQEFQEPGENDEE